jgi:hypothetical protein
MKVHYLLAAMAVLCVPAIALGVTAWSNANGTSQTGNFDWMNGQNDTDAFGSPDNSGDTLFFVHANFDISADSGDPTPDAITDTMDVDFSANLGKYFQSITLSVYGDYQITDQAPTGGNSVDAAFEMTATDYGANPDSPFSGSLDYYQTSGSDPFWNDSALITTTFPPYVTDLHLTVDGGTVAIATGDPGDAASITLNVALLAVSLNVIPEPATLSLLALGGLALLRRRR